MYSDLVVFNVFTTADEEAYQQAASPRRAVTVGSHSFRDEVRQIRQWVDEADRILIGAGGGLSADAGVDYTDEVDFAAKFPALVKRGLRCAYQMIGYSELEPAAFWGSGSATSTRSGSVTAGDVSTSICSIFTHGKDSFVLTSNVDALFVRNGFDPSRVCSIQGDFAFLQCLTPCSDDLWPSAPVLERLLREIDPDTQAFADRLSCRPARSAVGRCSSTCAAATGLSRIHGAASSAIFGRGCHPHPPTTCSSWTSGPASTRLLSCDGPWNARPRPSPARVSSESTGITPGCGSILAIGPWPWPPGRSTS